MDVKRDVSAYLAEIGRRGGIKGGPARMAALTCKQRQELARKAANARWSKSKKEKQK
jgi:hypothetical protein